MPNGFRVGVRGEGGAHARAVLLAPDLLPVHGEDPRDVGAQRGDLLGVELLGQEQIAVALELGALLVGQAHGNALLECGGAGSGRGQPDGSAHTH
ncbi:MAG: hypothetical protein U5L06_07775 [Rhodovibrio sp.]|nr:hypothetical protein [Rhodovibrio sp.]